MKRFVPQRDGEIPVPLKGNYQCTRMKIFHWRCGHFDDLNICKSIKNNAATNWKLKDCIESCKPIQLAIDISHTSCRQCTGNDPSLPLHREELDERRRIVLAEHKTTNAQRAKERDAQEAWIREEQERRWNKVVGLVDVMQMEGDPWMSQVWWYDENNTDREGPGSIFKAADLSLLDEEDVCPICYDTFPGKEVKKLPCGHVFELDCIIGWFDERNPKTCPNCRRPYRVISSERFKGRKLLRFTLDELLAEEDPNSKAEVDENETINEMSWWKEDGDDFGNVAFQDANNLFGQLL